MWCEITVMVTTVKLVPVELDKRCMLQLYLNRSGKEGKKGEKLAVGADTK